MDCQESKKLIANSRILPAGLECSAFPLQTTDCLKETAKLGVQDPYAFEAQDLHGADPFLQPSAAALYYTTMTLCARVDLRDQRPPVKAQLHHAASRSWCFRKQRSLPHICSNYGFAFTVKDMKQHETSTSTFRHSCPAGKFAAFLNFLDVSWSTRNSDLSPGREKRSVQ